ERRAALAAGSRPAIATSRIGVTIRDGAATPDIATPEAFRQALIDAHRVAFSDAAVGGSAGVYLARLFNELGLADAIKAKSMPQQSGGEVAARVANGEADLRMTLIARNVAVNRARRGPAPGPAAHPRALVRGGEGGNPRARRCARVHRGAQAG